MHVIEIQIGQYLYRVELHTTITYQTYLAGSPTIIAGQRVVCSQNHGVDVISFKSLAEYPHLSDTVAELLMRRLLKDKLCTQPFDIALLTHTEQVYEQPIPERYSQH